MLLMSRHLIDCDFLPANQIVAANTVVRINLAWQASQEELEEDLKYLEDFTGRVSGDIFLDVPIGRAKPPLHRWSSGDVVEIVKRHENIRYVGVSNVGEPDDLMFWIVKLPKRVVIVPKIESVWGCRNIRQIEQVLKPPKTVMLDHDDLFHDMIRRGEPPGDLYVKYVDELADFCRREGISLLRTAGVVFSDK